MSDIEKIINEAWENRDNVNQDSEQSLKDTINQMICLLYTSPSPRDRTRSRMPSSA